MLIIGHRVVIQGWQLANASCSADGQDYLCVLWCLVVSRSEDSQMDWLHSVVILKKYHVETVPPLTVVLTHL